MQMNKISLGIMITKSETHISHNPINVGQIINFIGCQTYRNTGQDTIYPIYQVGTTLELSYAVPDKQNLRKQKEPDKYDGQNIEWPEYICNFQQVARTMHFLFG